MLPSAADIATLSGIVVLLCLAGAVALNILLGSISTRGLVTGHTSRGAAFLSASRFQLLAVTLAAAFDYVRQVWQDPHTLPEISSALLLTFGGSQVLYLSTKFRGKRNQRFDL